MKITILCLLIALCCFIPRADAFYPARQNIAAEYATRSPVSATLTALPATTVYADFYDRGRRRRGARRYHSGSGHNSISFQHSESAALSRISFGLGMIGFFSLVFACYYSPV